MSDLVQVRGTRSRRGPSAPDSKHHTLARSGFASPSPFTMTLGATRSGWVSYSPSINIDPKCAPTEELHKPERRSQSGMRRERKRVGGPTRYNFLQAYRVS